MKHFYKLLFVVFFTPLFSFAQGNYKPGYVVTLNGDTLKGFINYQEWDKNPGSFSFRDNINAPVKTFSLANSTAFGITGLEFYVKKTVSISTDPVEASKLPSSLDTSHVIGTVFLRGLTTGKYLTLYSYLDNTKARYYVTDNTTGNTNELGYHLYANGDNSQAVQTVSKYRTQLENLAQKFEKNTEQVEQQITYAKYNTDDLLKIVVAVNGSSSKQFTVASSFGVRFFAGAAIADNTNTFTGALEFPAGNSVFPKINAGIDLLPNKNAQRVFFRIELSATRAQYSFFSPGDNNTGAPSETIKYSATMLSAAPHIICNFYNTDPLKAFVGAGLAINYASYGDYKTIKNYKNISTLVQDKYPDFNTTWLSIPLRAGILLKNKLEIYAAYSIPTSIVSYTDFDVKAGFYQAGFNYLFGGDKKTK